jgi:hypothetical protein
MTFSNRLVLAGNITLTLSRNDFNASILRVAGTLECGGVLTLLTNRYESYSIGQTFRLFNASSFAGSFSALNLPSSFQWDTSQLTNHGTIRIAGVAPITIPILPVMHTNGAITIRFQSVLGKQYNVQSAMSLQPPVHWVTSVTRTGNGGVISITFGMPDSIPYRFFRIRSN